MDAISRALTSIPAAYHWPLEFCAFSTAATWILSIITFNVSQVDRVWTFLPTIYTAYYALLPLWPQEPLFPLCPYTPKALGWVVATDFSPRAVLMFGLVFVWMCRLSYNTHRRGLFNSQDEDYRWAVLRSQLPPWLFQIVNLTFIAAIQNILLLLLGLPTKVASTVQPHTALTTSDILLAGLAFVVLALEFTADNQQYSFHAYKHACLAAEKGRVESYDEKKQWPGARLKWTPEDAKRGFVTKGLWAYTRHPNFACEQSFWWIINLIPLLSPSPPDLVSQSLDSLSLLPSPSTVIHEFPHALYPFLYEIFNPLVNILPALALTALFFSSSTYTEAITASKYSQYKTYQERVGMFQFTETCMKGAWLAWKGRKAEVDAALWGKEEKVEKED
ncbi:hypothetical protein Hypma_006881 [Hypsizygus marmoreus]|uniref:Steroid 5-alpha reductase C-terminal domain-containing protein n=1 Tax=Hypsizygus marmoreus TaxID=39966 RepID=A0A369K1J7_HYPMA|nr:hypothetical protein Hypma_006881 [Hypsizygus marmoreus]